ncbi:MAG: primosomal protein N', partial [Flavobacteriaceae bacterium]|nr:primosomal protein N' [Flavobacteriaceae bacterium]
MNFFVDVIVPLPLDIVFTYRVNEIEHKFIKEGTRVVVPFGNSKLITSIVIKKHSQIPKSYKTKEIEFIIDDNPIINLKQIEFFRWISNYYMTPIGQVLKNALPSLLLLRSESEIILIK